MFPIRDHNPSSKLPVITIALIAVNVLIHGYGMVAVRTDQQLYDFYTTYAMIPALVTNGDNYMSLLTSVFLHGDIMHLAGNMLFLWIFRR